MKHMQWSWLFLLPLVFGLLSCSHDPVEYTRDIAPVIHKNCLPCHRKDGPGPFTLLSYEQVVSKAKTIRHVTQHRIMPPWPADTSYTRFIGERVLTQKEIDLIGRWVEEGCQYGDSSLLPSPPVYPSGAYLGKPDMVVRMGKPFRVLGNNKDHFALMKLPFELEKDTFIRALEFIPHRKRLVHHVNGFMISYEPGKKKDHRTGDYYVDTEIHSIPEAYGMMHLANDDSTYPLLTASVVNYLPGVWPVIYPEGIGGWRMTQKGHFFLKDIHYGPSPLEVYDSSYINVYFASKPPQRKILEIQMGTLGVSPVEPPLFVPANEKKKFITRLKAPMDLSILTINPHMHLLGVSFKAYALTPKGDTIRLIHIPRWDFRWQYFYTFPKMVRIPKDSWIIAEGIFDNTSANPLNPHKPPIGVGERSGSMRTSDEMFQFIINYLPYKEGDETISLQAKPD